MRDGQALNPAVLAPATPHYLAETPGESHECPSGALQWHPQPVAVPRGNGWGHGGAQDTASPPSLAPSASEPQHQNFMAEREMPSAGFICIVTGLLSALTL